MTNKNKQKIIDKINLAGASVGFFLIILGLFRLLKLDTKYIIFTLIIIGIIFLIWRAVLDKTK